MHSHTHTHTGREGERKRERERGRERARATATKAEPDDTLRANPPFNLRRKTYSHERSSKTTASDLFLCVRAGGK